MSEEKAENHSHSTHHSSDTITIKKDSLWKYTTFILAAIIIVGIIVFFVNGNGSNTNTNTGNNNPTPNVPSPTQRVTIDTTGAPMLGSASAKVTLVEYSDFQCPFCRQFFSVSNSQIKTNYLDSGKVKLYFKQFPLASLHPMAQKSAEAALCVKEKGGDAAFWKMHDKMFEEQNKLDGGDPLTGPVKSTVTYTTDSLKTWAKALGYDISSCLDTGKYATQVSKEESEGASFGVQGTPSFFINGQIIEGACPYSTFQQAFDAELAGKTWSVSNCQVTSN